jgi:hypothetical protein
MPRPRKNITLDFAAIDAALNTGSRLDLKRIASQHGTCPPVIRRILSEHYGDKITFKPGRNGGIQWNAATTNTNPATVADTETVSV